MDVTPEYWLKLVVADSGSGAACHTGAAKIQTLWFCATSGATKCLRAERLMSDPSIAK